ncbi:hypothetical protein ACFLTZ_06835, partial [Chloroflexota bacterium]
RTGVFQMELCDHELGEVEQAGVRYVLRRNPERVKEITVTQQQIQLNYTLPLPPDGLTEDRVEVLPIVRYGGRYWT